MAQDITPHYLKHADKLQELIHGVIKDDELGDRSLSVLASLSTALVGIVREYIEEFSDRDGLKDFVDSHTEAVHGRLLKREEKITKH